MTTISSHHTLDDHRVVMENMSTSPNGRRAAVFNGTEQDYTLSSDNNTPRLFISHDDDENIIENSTPNQRTGDNSSFKGHMWTDVISQDSCTPRTVPNDNNNTVSSQDFDDSSLFDEFDNDDERESDYYDDEITDMGGQSQYEDDHSYQVDLTAYS